MTEGTEAITHASLSLALDAAARRHEAIAANIANAEVPGYVAQRVDFERFVADARRELQARGRLDAATLRPLLGQVPPLEPALDANGQPLRVKLDTEVAAMAQNAVHYQALLKGLSRHLALLHSAASDGKR